MLSLSFQSVFLTSYLGFLRSVTAPSSILPPYSTHREAHRQGFFLKRPIFFAVLFFRRGFRRRAVSILPPILITGEGFVKPFFRRGLTFFSTIFIRILNILGLRSPSPLA
jgi:hypothetical protein